MANFKASAIIHKNVAEVFAFITNPDNIPEIMPNVVKWEKVTEGAVGKGTKIKETRAIRGRSSTAEIEFIDFEQNRHFAIENSNNGLVVIYRYMFTEIPEGTQADLKAEVKTSGVRMRLTKPIIVKMLKQEDGNQLKYLKKMLEK
ncbi:SRPBCC family protein [Bacillaceae bacterium Marseille-Q3522]|nr:SRPBCC family protein [Bacillaceae bacterium Marseille-Q3522]